MCTLIVLSEAIDGYPLVVAANRDEHYDRPSLPPAITGDVICPRDLHKGGTWLGVARGGWFAGLTNQVDAHQPHLLASRGHVVDACLKAGNHLAVAQYLQGLDRGVYNNFNLVFGRPGAIFLCRVWGLHALEMLVVPAGTSVFTNDCWDGQFQAKAERARELTTHLAGAVPIHDVKNALFAVLSDHQHGDDPRQSMCIHADGWGTRSTSIITVSNEGAVEYYYSDGAPCRSPGVACVGVLSIDDELITDADLKKP